MDKDVLLKQITILDFMALDLHLFLNTHPTNADALKMYNDVIANAEKSRCLYEENYGPLTAYRSEGAPGWPWQDCPWPWQEQFNFTLCGAHGEGHI